MILTRINYTHTYIYYYLFSHTLAISGKYQIRGPAPRPVDLRMCPGRRGAGAYNIIIYVSRTKRASIIFAIGCMYNTTPRSGFLHTWTTKTVKKKNYRESKDKNKRSCKTILNINYMI